MWVRGLKPCGTCDECVRQRSHPMWVRGLKHNILTGLETTISRTLCGCVD